MTLFSIIHRELILTRSAIAYFTLRFDFRPERYLYKR